MRRCEAELWSDISGILKDTASFRRTNLRVLSISAIPTCGVDVLGFVHVGSMDLCVTSILHHFALQIGGAPRSSAARTGARRSLRPRP